MEALVLVLVIVLVIWYFGATINKVANATDHIVSGAVDMGSDEFGSLKRDQKIRIYKERIRQSKEAVDLSNKAKVILNDNDFDKLLNLSKNK